MRIPRQAPRSLLPAASHRATICGVVDLGSQPGPYGLKRQIWIGFETPATLTEKGKPFVLGKYYNVYANQQSALKEMLDALYGRVLDEDEVYALNLNEALLGRTARIGVMHDVAKVRAKINSVGLPPSGTRPLVPTITDPITFSFNEDGTFDRKQYEHLPGWLQHIVAKSIEYQKPSAPQTVKERLDEKLNGGTGMHEEFDDGIPF